MAGLVTVCRQTTLIVLGSALVLSPLLAVQASDRVFDEKELKEKLLTTLPLDVEIWRQGISDKHLSDVARFGFPFFTLDGQTVSYIGNRDGQMYAWVNGEESEPYDLVRYLIHSHDGKHVAFQGNSDGEWCVVIDGKASPFYRDATEVTFSRKKDQIAYRYQKEKQWHLVLNDEVVGRYFFIDRLVFSPDGKRLTGIGNTGKGMVYNVVDGKRVGAEWDRTIGKPVFSADSKSLAYVADGSGRQWVVENNSPKKKYRKVEHVQFVGKKNQLCYIATQGRSKRLILGGSELPKYRWVSPPFFGRKARQPMYAVNDKGDLKVMVGEKLYKDHGKVGEEPRDFTWSADGKSFAYIARDGKEAECVYHVDKKLPSFMKLYPRLFLSSDGEHLAYLGENDKQKVFVVINGTVSEPYDDVYPKIHYSKKGKKIAYCARKGREIWWKVVDL